MDDDSVEDAPVDEDLSVLSDEELVARVRVFEPLDLMTAQYMEEIDRRGGPGCLSSDPELQAEYQALVDDMLEPMRRMMDNMGIGQQFRDALAPEPPEFTFASTGFEMDPEEWKEISEALEKSSPAALHSALVSTLEGGFGPIHDELTEMRASLKELERNAPGKRAGSVLLWAAIIAAVTGVAAVIIAIVK